jgi:hypothetical protein
MLVAAALFAMAWTIARACLRSITLDEASAYQLFAAPDWARCWYPSSGNHVLNTVLGRGAVKLFGLSEPVLRIPALAGAGVYIAACYGLCTRISQRRSIRLSLFVCLVYNPFVMDYLAAARGYGLALGLLMAAIWAMAGRRHAIASICIGLSFCANFSFAWIDAAAILLFAAHELRNSRNWRAVALSLVPGGVTALLLCGWTVSRWPAGQLYYGAASLREMWTSIAAATFDEWTFAPVPAAIGIALTWLVVAVLAWQMWRIVAAGHSLGLLVGRIFAVALLCHWLAFRLAGIPLPLARTAIFFVPLATLVIGIGASLPGTKLPRAAGVATLSLCSLYFVGCLRLSHFKEWKFDAEVKETFAVLEDMHRRSALREVETNWRYCDPLNFYREARRAGTMPEFTWKEPHTEGKAVYVLYAPIEQDFIARQSLQVVWRGKRSDVVIAVRAADRPSE